MSAYKALPVTTSPEITRTDMTTPILQLKSLGIDDLMKFDWVSAPPAESVLRALEGLHASGMIDENGRLTPIGEQVSECPVEVGIARMVLAFLEHDIQFLIDHASYHSYFVLRITDVEKKSLQSLQ